MKKYYVTAICSCFVEANSKDEAVEKAEDGQFVDDVDWQYEQFEVEEAGDRY